MAHYDDGEHRGLMSDVVQSSVDARADSGQGVKARLLPQLVATSVVSLAPLAVGCTVGFSSPTQAFLKSRLSKEELAWYSSLVTIGAIFGGPLAGVAAERWGRKVAILMSCVPFALGWLLITAAHDGMVMLYVGRVLTGLAMGMSSLVVPMYIAEIASKELRGMLGSTFQLFIFVGILAVYSFCIPFNDVQWPAVICSCVTAVLSVTIVWLPESPRWLILNGLRPEGLAALRWLRGEHYDVQAECQETEDSLLAQAGQSVSLMELFCNRRLLKPLIISLTVMAIRQCTGINVFVFNMQSIFNDAGFDRLPHIPSIVIAAIQVLANFVACLVVDRVGRRLLLLTGGVFIVLSNVAFGVFYYLAENQGLDRRQFSWLPLASLVTFVVAFSFSFGPVSWVIMSELFKPAAKTKACSVATIVNWAFGFLLTNRYSQMASPQHGLHDYGTLWFYGAATALGVVFVALMLPETKGKSLEQIHSDFEASAEYTRI